MPRRHTARPEQEREKEVDVRFPFLPHSALSDCRRQHPADADSTAQHSRGLLGRRRRNPADRSLVSFRLSWQERRPRKGSDVYLFLIGMMLLSELAREHGVFDWLSSAALKGAHGYCALSFHPGLRSWHAGHNFYVQRRNRRGSHSCDSCRDTQSQSCAVTLLFACAMIANAASFVLPISNPANLVVFHANMPPLGRWL